ncbi:hypothetical protein NBRC116188_28450 [Oceaniserpentilla sp. 4NH20-0058]|uniref:hypothetical protein n=1 Tax=Oceaniserpentilla sp. 4NH20-0058 TaxID=3127660 RepID=UPI003105EBE0
MLRVALSLSLMLVSLSSMALTPFERHFLAVTQGMSSFYMYLLSNEDKKFKVAYEKQFDLATEFIIESKDPSKQNILKRWMELKPTLAYDKSKGMGLLLPQSARLGFRAYVVDLYLEFQKNPKGSKYAINAYERIQIFSSLLSARSLDLDSSIYGTNLFNDHDRLLDQVEVANQVEADLKALLGSGLPKSYQKQLRRIEAKFRFMKPSLVDYDTRSATYLLYQNALAIDKIMTEQQQDQNVIASSLL